MSTHRIKFAKRGSLIFVSHLDFAHSFTRALKRAELPLKYSEGFNPHPKQVFALPLSVGMVGENELCDITLTEDFSHEEVKARLENAFTHEIEIKEVFDPELKMGKVKSAKYVLVFENLACGKDALEKALETLYVKRIQPLIKKKGLSALVYTEVSDVEDETNGLLTYDREIVKVDIDFMKKINENIKL